MLTQTLSFALALLLMSAAVPVTAAASGSSIGVAARTDLPHAQDRVLVKFTPGANRQGAGNGGVPIHGRWRTYPVPPGRTPMETVGELLEHPSVEVAELDYRFQIDPQPNYSEVELAGSAEVNDPGLSFQWHLAAVQASDAWAMSSGGGVVVAVVDSGVSLGGEDLSCHTLVAPYNAITRTAGIAAVQDDNGHGTHVAGTVAQCTNNGVGVAGVAPDVSLMPVKVLNGGSGNASDIARGIDWAHSRGADVINVSLGCASCSSSMLDEVIEEAAADGVILVGAAGNSNVGSVFYPASHPDVISVGATDLNNLRAPYSNWGSGLDLVAPGGDNDQDANLDGFGDGVLQETFVSGTWGYYFFNGTSMAAPHVSAAAAILLAKEPRADRDTIQRALESTALDLGAGGYDTVYGHGLIQIHDALMSDLARPTWPSGASIDVSRVGETTVSVSWNAAVDNVGVTEYRIGPVGTTGVTTTSRKATISGLRPGTQYVFEVSGRDQAGNWSKPLTASVRTARSFSDTSGHTFYDDILWMSGMDVTRGCNPPENDLFCPDDQVTRGQMAAFVVRALGLKANDHSGFADVSSSSTFADDIGRLATAGITQGCNPPANDRFCPEDSVTRAQMAAFLVRALGLAVDDHSGFMDVPEGSTFASDIGKLATSGITRGCNPAANDRFCPDEPITRGQLAAFLHRALD